MKLANFGRTIMLDILHNTTMITAFLLLSSGLLALSRLRRPRPPALRGILWDLDGTLLDFEGASHEALNDPLRSLGKEVTWELHARIVGTPVSVWSVEIVRELGVEGEISHEAYARGWHRAVVGYFKEMNLLPGALEFVRAVKRDFPNVKMAIATSSERENFNAKIMYHPELLELMDAVVTGDEIVRGKPNPDIFQEAARRIGIDPKYCVVFEDSPSGVIGGKAAGALVVAIPDNRMSGNEHKFKDADFRLNALHELNQPQNKVRETLWGMFG